MSETWRKIVCLNSDTQDNLRTERHRKFVLESKYLYINYYEKLLVLALEPTVQKLKKKNFNYLPALL